MSDDDFDDRPSKSARKRAAHAAQDLGARLIGLREAELATLDLPEPLNEAIREARRLTSRGALARQRQYIGRLMRRIDSAGVEAALGALSRESAEGNALHKQVERWRERLLAGGDTALDAFEAEYAPIDRPQLGAVLAAARDTQSTSAARTAAARALFRALRGLISRKIPR